MPQACGKTIYRTDRKLAIKIALNSKKNRKQLTSSNRDQNCVERCCRLDDMGLFGLHCIAICSRTVCVVKCGDSRWVCAIWSLSCFNFNASLLLWSTLLNLHFRLRPRVNFACIVNCDKLQDGVSRFLALLLKRDSSPSFRNVTMTSLQCSSN